MSTNVNRVKFHIQNKTHRTSRPSTKYKPVKRSSQPASFESPLCTVKISAYPRIFLQCGRGDAAFVRSQLWTCETARKMDWTCIRLMQSSVIDMQRVQMTTTTVELTVYQLNVHASGRKSRVNEAGGGCYHLTCT